MRSPWGGEAGRTPCAPRRQGYFARTASVMEYLNCNSDTLGDTPMTRDESTSATVRELHLRLSSSPNEDESIRRAIRQKPCPGRQPARRLNTVPSVHTYDASASSGFSP